MAYWSAIIFGIAFILLALGSLLSNKCATGAWRWLNYLFILLFLALGIYNLYIGLTRNAPICLGNYF